MNTSDLDRIRQDWKDFKGSTVGEPSTPEATLGNAERAEELLRRCVDAGATTADAVERERLQIAAREMADFIFQSGRPYPNAVIRSPSEVALSEGGRGRAFWFSGWRRRGRAVESIKVLGIVIVGVGVVVAVPYYWTKDIRKQLDTASDELNGARARADASEAREKSYLNAAGSPAVVLTERDQARAAAASLHAALRRAYDTLNAEDQKNAAYDNCLKVIRGCCVTEGKWAGAIRMMANPAAPDDVWVVPSCANLAAHALLAARSVVPEADRQLDTDRVRRWLVWYAGQTTAETKTAAAFRGATNAGQPGRISERIEAIPGVDDQEAAATHLSLVEAYYTQMGVPKTKEDESIVASAKRSHRAILSRPVPLEPWAKPNPTFFYFSTGVIDCGGLVAATKLFAAQGERELAAEAAGRAKVLAERLPDFLLTSGPTTLFAPAYNMETKRYEPAPSGLTDGAVQANLFGLMWVRQDKKTWQILVSESRPGNEASPGLLAPSNPVENWLAAAAAIGVAKEGTSYDKQSWDYRARFAAYSFAPSSTYVNRAALTLLMLSEGYVWRFGVADAAKLNSP